MSDRPFGDGWWLASDGKWYPPETRPGEPAPPPPDRPPAEQSRRIVGRGLTGTLQGFFYATAAAGAGAAIAMAYEALNLDAGEARLAATFTDAAPTGSAFAGLLSLAGIVAAILMMVWLYKAYAAAESRGGTERSWSAGWAVGSWFIPLANLILPKLVVNEVDRMSHPDAAPEPIGARWKEVPALAVSHLWWGFTVVALIAFGAGFGLVAEEIDRFGFDAELYRAGLWLLATGSLLSIAAGVFGAQTVRSIGRRL